jgi:hypothetical protein
MISGWADAEIASRASDSAWGATVSATSNADRRKCGTPTRDGVATVLMPIAPRS